MDTTFGVHVEGDMRVQVNTSMLAAIEDPLLAEEITHEAIRMVVSDKLGGFDGFTLSRTQAASNMPSKSRSAFTANVDLDTLAGCIEKLQTREAAAVEALKTSHEAVEVCLSTLNECSALSTEELRAMLTVLLDTTRPPRAHDQSERLSDAPEECTVGAAVVEEELGSDECGSKSSSSHDSDYTCEREAMGYQRLLDDDEEAEAADEDQ